jgi:hypothetical protein
MRISHSFSFVALGFTVLLAACGAPSTPGATGAHMKMSLKDLVKLGQNYTCTFSQTDAQGNKTTGTVYVQADGKNFRGDFETMMNGKTQMSHMISADKTSYIWSDGEKQGMMMHLKAGDDSLFGGGSSSTGADQNAAVSEDQPEDMDCARWFPEQSKFAPPADHQFIDFEEQMKAMQNGMGKSQCGACDQIPDAAGKAQCRQALGC